MRQEIQSISNRITDLRVYSNRDKEILVYILDLIELYSIANSKTRQSIVNQLTNYVLCLELSAFNRYN